MITMVFLKALCDLGIYYTFAGFFAALWGASPSLLLAALPVQALCFAASFPLRRSPLRFLPLAAVLLCGLFPGAGLPEYAAFAPPAAYLAWLAARGRYFPEWSHQAEVFSRFWKLFFLFLLLALAFGGAKTLTAVTIPAGAATLLCSVLLNRTLRHDPEVYCQRRCQILNLVVVAGTGLCAFLLSSPAFLQGCLAALQAAYTYLVAPVLMLLVCGMTAVLAAVLWLFSWLKPGSQLQGEDLTLNIQSAAESLGIQEMAGGTPAYLERVALAAAVLAAALLLAAAFRYLARRSGGVPASGRDSQRREPLSSRRWEGGGPPESAYIQRVRAQYRRFLRLYRRAGFSRHPGDTSRDIARQSQEAMGEEASALRDLYIGARYGGVATREDVLQARKLCDKLKRRQTQ